jgi:chlorobactene glucosyltransferase
MGLIHDDEREPVQVERLGGEVVSDYLGRRDHNGRVSRELDAPFGSHRAREDRGLGHEQRPPNAPGVLDDERTRRGEEQDRLFRGPQPVLGDHTERDRRLAETRRKHHERVVLERRGDDVGLVEPVFERAGADPGMVDGRHRVGGQEEELFLNKRGFVRKVVLATWEEVLLVIYAVGVLLFQGLAIVYALRMPPLRPSDPRAPVPGTSVGVVIPARNEVDDLPHCLDDLMRQEFPPQAITVVDGGSTDGTAAQAQQRSPPVHLVPEPPLPSGWVGKNWACSTGAGVTPGEYLLFTDADMRYAPATLRLAVAWAQEEKADLVSLAPRVEMVGFWERVVLPFMTQLILTYFRAPSVNHDTSRAAMANGQFLLTKRSSYDAVGGHAVVQGAVLEDVALARRYRAAGRRLRLAWAPELVSTRMYRNRQEMDEGLLKNLHGTEFSAWRQVGFLVGLVALFWLPLALLPIGLLEGSLVLVAVGALLWVAMFGKHVAFTRAVGGRARDGLLFPVAVGYYAWLFARSLSNGFSRKAVTWKGRTYPIER